MSYSIAASLWSLVAVGAAVGAIIVARWATREVRAAEARCMKLDLSDESKEDAAAMIREWARYWCSDYYLGEKDEKLDDDPDAQLLVIRLFERLLAPDSVKPDKS